MTRSSLFFVLMIVKVLLGNETCFQVAVRTSSRLAPVAKINLTYICNVGFLERSHQYRSQSISSLVTRGSLPLVGSSLRSVKGLLAIQPRRGETAQLKHGLKE